MVGVGGVGCGGCVGGWWEVGGECWWQVVVVVVGGGCGGDGWRFTQSHFGIQPICLLTTN